MLALCIGTLYFSTITICNVAAPVVIACVLATVLDEKLKLSKSGPGLTERGGGGGDDSHSSYPGPLDQPLYSTYNIPP